VSREWDARTYDRIADPMTRWGTLVLDRLSLTGSETVLDAGCGSGRVTERLLERLPRGRVVALDASEQMIEEARRRLGPHGDRVEYVMADLAEPLPLTAPVDAILSTATLHWVRDHDAVFWNLAAVLHPDGQLVAQCGGAGNLASVWRVLRDLGEDWPGPWRFATPEETAQRLETADFDAVRTWLNDEPTVLEPGQSFETYLATVVLRAHLERLPEAQRAPFVHAVAERLGHPQLDYVRLNIVARRR